MQFKKYRKSFTLIEILIVMIIIGALAVLAVPRYFNTTEKMRSQEAVHTLTTLYAAQKRYYVDNGSYKVGTGPSKQLAAGDLDIDIPASGNFNTPKIDNNAGNVAEITRTGSTYTLSMDASGGFHCSPSPPSICSRMGYPP